MIRKALYAGVPLLLAASMALAKEEPKSIPWMETGPFNHVSGSGPYRFSRELLKHQRNMAQLAATGASVPDAESQDVGDVAVIVDNGSIFIDPRPANPFDLSVPTALSFVPTPIITSTSSGGQSKGKKNPPSSSQSVSNDSFDVAFSAVVLDTTFGANLGLGDDDTTEVTFPAGFPFLGTNHTSIWINSDGNITLGAGDSASTARDAARHIGGPPRVSPLFVDLDPTSVGSVHADVRADRLVVTWNGVPEFGATNSNTFQAVLHDDGSIDLVYDNVDAIFAVVGVAEGDNQGPLNEIDLTADLPGTFGAGAIFEEFAAALPLPLVDVIAVAKEFYKTHADKYDFLVIFSEPVALLDPDGAAFAFHLGIQNQTQGLGFFNPPSDDTDLIGPDIDELESILNMNRIGLYWPDANKMENPPIKMFRFACGNAGGQVVPCGATLDGPPGSNQISRRARWAGTLNGDFEAFGSYTLGLNSAMSIMGQEAGHRWLAFPLFLHPTKGFNGIDNLDLLGRGNAHWSFFFNVTVPANQFGGDPRASSAEGNSILNLGPNPFPGQLPFPCTNPNESTFLTERNELIDGYTELDQYFMGFRSAEDVAGFWYVDEPRSAFSNASLQGAATLGAQDDIIFCGKQVDLTVDDIAAIGTTFNFPPNGPRIPAIGDEVDSCGEDVKTMAFILLVEQGPPGSAAHASAISQVEIFRQTWEAYVNGPATDGLGMFDTDLDPDCF